jgi:hypothetical protein
VVRICALLAAVSLSLLACAEAAAAPTLSVTQVKAQLKQLHGKPVRVRGQMNECHLYSCNLCTEGPNDDPARVCVTIGFAIDPHPITENDFDEVARRAGRLLEEVYRFATITVAAQVDASCVLGYDPDEKPVEGEVNEIVCLHGGATLADARVAEVHARRPATEGAFDEYLGAPLVEATPALRAEVLAERNRAYPPEASDPPEDVRVYADEDLARYMKIPSVAWICVCREPSCDGRWPRFSGHQIRSPANPYACSSATLRDGRWYVEP